MSSGNAQGFELAGAVEKPHNDGRARAETRETTKHAEGITQYATLTFPELAVFFPMIPDLISSTRIAIPSTLLA